MDKSVRRLANTSWLSLLIAPLILLSGGIALAQQPSPAPAPSAGREINAHASERLVDSSIVDDSAVDKMLAAYSPKVRALDSVIGTLKGPLRKGGMGAGSLGNFVADGMRAEASRKLGKPVDLAIINAGGLRRDAISEGDVRARDIFELLPFENALVTMDLTGAQLINLLGVVTARREGQSGALITYRTNAEKRSEFESARLFDEQYHDLPIDPKTTYTVVTIDYLINVGGATYSVLREGKNTRPLGITVRDAIMDYIKSETAAGRALNPNPDGRFILDKANSIITGEPPPQ